MLFNSLHFLLFFPLIVILYYLLPHRFRWGLLLIASYYFYASWKVEYLGLIILSTVIDFYASSQMSKFPNKKDRRKYLFLSLFSNLGLLFIFKYFNFFRDSLNMVIGTPYLPALNVLLPVGISFYTFQTLSYTIDVYRGDKEAEKNFGIFALYVSFFPQLVAGPIERATRLLPQFHEKHQFDYDRIVNGLQLILWGFFKKLVVADRLGSMVNSVYNDPTNYSGFPLIIATYFFAFQIYCDFSGYSDIAIGTAQILGFDLMENFKRPYYAKSIPEFWRRWHISLSTWFRDYLYIPLGGNRVSKSRFYFNMIVVFLVSGLWHGAAWTFVIWGALHGLYMFVSTVTHTWQENLWQKLKLNQYPWVKKSVQLFITFNLVCFAWIFFRANSIADALYISSHLFQINNFNLGYSIIDLVLALVPITIMETVHLVQRSGKIRNRINRSPPIVRWAIYSAAVFLILYLGVFDSQDFIYFQF